LEILTAMSTTGSVIVVQARNAAGQS